MENVPDPTDFPSEALAPGLRKLDSAFSCQICGEVFDAPMMLPCGHSFCSMCVRRSLRDRHECPSCRAPAEEVHLTKNAQLEDIGDSWRSARATILSIIEKADKLAKEALESAEANRPRKRFRQSTPITPRANRTSGPSTDRSSADILETSEDEVGLIQGEFVPSSDVEEIETQLQMGRLVDCPICSRPIINKNINAHIDSGCRSFVTKPKSRQPDSKSAWNTVFNTGNGSSKPASRGKGKTQDQRISADENVERLPKPSYSVLKDKKIRDMLANHQLQTTGTREQLIARHTQFVLLFNANLDRAEHLRKPISGLRKELKKWEGGLNMKKVSVDDAQAYVKVRNSEFKKHIEAARESSRKTKQSLDLKACSSDSNEASRSATPTEPLASSIGSKQQPRHKALVERTIISDSEEGEELF